MKGSVTLTGPHAEDGGKKLDEDGSRTAISTYCGYEFDIMNSKTWLYDDEKQIYDIATALSNVTRFNGHTQFYSVGEHSLRVADWLREEGYGKNLQRLGLWHDATEAYLGDVPRPHKRLFSINGRPFAEVEEDLASVILEHHGILNDELSWKIVKEADKAVYLLERDERPYCAMAHKYSARPDVVKNIWLLRDEVLRA